MGEGGCVDGQLSHEACDCMGRDSKGMQGVSGGAVYVARGAKEDVIV